MARWSGRLADTKREIEHTPEYKTAGIAVDIASQVHRALVENGMSKKELADRLQVSKSQVSQLLGGDANPTISTLVRVAEALNREVGIHFLAPQYRPSTAPVQIGDDAGSVEGIRRYPAAGVDVTDTVSLAASERVSVVDTKTGSRDWSYESGADSVNEDTLVQA